MNRIKLGIVSCFYLGCSPVAPGTAGTLGGVAIAWLLCGSEHYLWLSLAAAAFLYVVGRSLGEWSERYAGEKDPGIFVLDEVIGYLITVAWLRGPSWLGMLVGFLVFRVFDIFKPWPARRMERLGGGDGILLDDVVSGIWGFAAMYVLRLAFPGQTWFWAG
jgi:phosphatidylglycerophosphatase A